MMEDDQILQLMERVCVSLPFWLASDLGSLMFFLVIAIQQGGGEPQVGLPTTTGRMPQRERLLVGFTGSTLAGLGDPQTSLR